jgi:Rrf2 family protein
MAIHYIAVHDEVGSVSTKRIAEEFGIPAELLAKILQRLAKRGLVVSQNGPKGGYALGRRPSEITIGDVVRAIEGPVNIVSCLEDKDCPQAPRCNLRRPIQKVQAAISHVLDSMSLAELAGDDVPELLALK